MDIKKLRTDWDSIVNEYPGLYLVQGIDDFFLQGELKFNAKYNDIEIEDSYNLKIMLHNYPKEVPIVIETGNRIPPKPENHINSNGTICLGNRLECYERFDHNLSCFIKNILIPFLYANSFKERYKKYPWKQLAHFSWGILEYYQEKFHLTEEETLTLFKNVDRFYKTKGHHQCLCGKNIRFRDCCRSKLIHIQNDPDKLQLFYLDICEVLKALNMKLKQQNFESFLSQTHA